jgi:hypothetical protein
VDRDAGEVRYGGEWALDAGRRRAGSRGVLDIDLAAITQAGGWKSPRMLLQFAEKINATRCGMARAAAATGRDEAVSEEG